MPHDLGGDRGSDLRTSTSIFPLRPVAVAIASVTIVFTAAIGQVRTGVMSE